MSTFRAICYYDQRTQTLTIRSTSGGIQFMIKFAEAAGTIQHIRPDEDCDNYWVAFKPADSAVFFDEPCLFSKARVVIEELSWRLEP